MRFLLVALVALLFAGDAFATAGAYPNATCSNADTVQTRPTIKPGAVLSFCPGATVLTQYIAVKNMADCNWDNSPADSAAGDTTLSVKKCVGTAAAGNCDTPMVDSGGSAWVVTSDDATARFSLTSGVYLITANNANSTTGVLLCTGR